MNRKAKISAIAASALALAGIAGGAYAAIPSTTGSVYHACVNNTGPLHSVYMIDKDAGESCFGGYTEKTWNQTGPAGATGATGATGPAGSSAFVRVTVTDSTPTTITEIGGDGVTLNYTYEYDAVANCPTGYVSTGGGLATASLVARLPGYKTGPTADGKGWRAYIVEGSNSDSLGVTAICAAGTTSP